ncbi:hypothetical protein N7478_002920 [Penicillium angulare]|uniref:uncharacterized protein n=1 Tax=Penicillium angulare TaxID=116970 RepID=UPI0025416D15|nr:uncharacterized protein N7478_002920 [Penicillium angulare]KAJ5287234.1 hypothetical protein N7478_002920 [Penicillium angulare]
MDPSQSLVSQKSSDSDLHIQLHPLVLLTISDHITRHAARQQQGPILGALLGQQNGRVITLEHAFECPTTAGPNGEASLPSPWFEERVKQFKDVHKEPPLDLVGWWSTAPTAAPDPSHLSVHRQLLQDYNESAIFLAFHPSQLQASESHNAKLPLTIYESVIEGENVNDASKDMQIDGEELVLKLRFRELRYSVETGESEMIGVNTIVQGSGTAAVDTYPLVAGANTGNNPQSVKQGTRGDKDGRESNTGLTQEEEELLANLTTRLNAIRTLESRISLLKSYVANISPESGNADSTSVTWSHPLLRDISSLLSHLSLLSPSEQSSFATEVVSQNNDVLLASLLGKMGESVKAMRELGRKSAIVQNQRKADAHAQRRQRYPDFGSGGGVSSGFYP